MAGYNVIKNRNTQTVPQEKQIPVGSYKCDMCGIEADEEGMCPSCGTQIKADTPTDTTPDMQTNIMGPRIMPAIKTEERKELRQFINENIELDEADDVTPERVADEWRRAGEKLKGIPSKAKELAGRLKGKVRQFKQKRLARLQKKDVKVKYKLKDKVAKHGLRKKISGLKQKRAKKTLQVLYPNTEAVAPSYWTQKQGLKRRHKINKLKRKLDRSSELSQYD